MSASGRSRGDLPLARPLQGLVDACLQRWADTEADAEHTPEVAAVAAAVADGGLRVAYQPIVELASQRVVAVEALVRPPAADDPGLEDAPAVVEVAERSGLIHALGTYVLVHACSQLAAWRQHRHLADLEMHVNVSPLQLRDERFVDTVERTLAVTGLPHRAVTIEVTETAAMEADGRGPAALAALDAMDVRISIDDFGTGFASLDLLAETPARSMKLDRSFVSSVGDLLAPPRGRALVVPAAIALGRTLGLQVVAEGIERPEQVRTLEAWGCEYGQGYLFAPPRPAAELDLSPPAPPARTPAGRVDRPRGLSTEAVELALAVATVLMTASPESRTLRSHAQDLALLLAETYALDRRLADTAGVLTAIADAPQRLGEVVRMRSDVPAAAELARALATRPRVGPDATAGGLAAAARQLALAHREGEGPESALARVDPDAGPDLRARLRDWWSRDRASTPPLTDLRALERRLRVRDDASRRLRALSAMTQAVGRSGSLEDVLDVTAEEARAALGAASLSISRVESERGLLRTVVNVGDLAPWEQRRPVDETYVLADHPLVAERLLDRGVHVLAPHAPTAPDQRPETELLARLGKSSSASAPIVIDGIAWGEVYATTHHGSPPFTPADTPFLTAVANVVGLVVQRARQDESPEPVVGEDPLTRLADRRALEAHVTAELAEGEHEQIAMLMLDVEGLRAVNAEFGPGAGDALLVDVANALNRVAVGAPGSFVARVAGDEFVLVLPGSGHEIEDLLLRLRQRLADAPPPQPRLAAGLAVVRHGATLAELLQRAEAAMYLAERTGAPLAAIGPDSEVPVPPTRSGRRNEPTPPALTDVPGHAEAWLRRWSNAVERGDDVRRIEALGEAALGLLDLSRWVASEAPAGEETLLVRSIHMRRKLPREQGYVPLSEQRYDLTEYPTTAEALRAGGGFAVHVDNPASDPGERAMLADLGLAYVIGITNTDERGDRWLLELFGDDRSLELVSAVPLVEALASRTFGREIRCQGPASDRDPAGE